jgi:hypothetical protein
MVIPAELQQKNQWVVWKKDGKKIPVNPKTGGNAQSNNPDTWGSYADATKVVEDGKADGIGFMFNNDFVGIDLDDCLDENKKAKTWAAEIMRAVFPAYMEYSISGKGIHIFLPRTEQLPGPGLNVNFKKYNLYDGIGGVEMYENGRYFITTGNILNEKTSKITGNVATVIPYYVRYKTLADRAGEIQKKSSLRNSDIDVGIFDEIRKTVTMESILSRYGYHTKNHKLCCPFHKEDTPSFHVYEKDYFCFGCREYGDAVTFVMKHEGLQNNFEAAKKISEYFSLGVEIPEKNKSQKKSRQANLNIDTSKILPEEVELIIRKAFKVSSIEPYDNESAEIVNSGIPTLDKLIGGFEMGLTTVWTGINAAGKSTVLGQAMIESIEQGYKVFAFSGELRADKFQYWVDLQAAGEPYLTKKVSQRTGKDYYLINESAKKKIHEWYGDRFYLYDNKNGMKYEAILEVMDAFNVHVGCKVFLIDNIMRLDMRNLDRDQYEAQSQFINSISDFAQNRKIHVHVVAHPRKIMGTIITKMDVAGSGDLTNRADNVLAVHRITAAFKNEFEKNNPKMPRQQRDKIINASNAIEIFKTRDAGVQDLLIPLKYCEGNKRIVDIDQPGLEHKRYSWDKAHEETKGDAYEGDDENCPF